MKWEAVRMKKALPVGIEDFKEIILKNYYYIDFDDTTVKPVILFWQQVEPMLKRCSKESEKRL